MSMTMYVDNKKIMSRKVIKGVAEITGHKVIFVARLNAIFDNSSLIVFFVTCVHFQLISSYGTMSSVLCWMQAGTYS